MSLNVKVKPQIHNRFDIFKENVKTGMKEQVGYAENIVLDAMWPRLCGGSTYFTHIHYGTGTGTLSPARTSLFSYLGNGSAGTVETVRAMPTSHCRKSIVLALSTAVGQTLTEVGIAYGTGSTNLVTHAQIRDMNGNPTGIVKTDVDIITIYATVYVTLLDNANSRFSYAHESVNALLTYLLGGSFPSLFFYAGEGTTETVNGEHTGLISKPIWQSGALTWTADVPNKKRVSNVVRMEVDQGNGHIQELALAGGLSSELLLSGICRLHLPATGIYSGLELTDVPLGTGDAANDVFNLPSRNIDLSSLVVKEDGVVTTAFIVSQEDVQKSILAQLNTTDYYQASAGSERNKAAWSGDGTVFVHQNTKNGILRICNLNKGISTLEAAFTVSAYDGISINYDGTVFCIDAGSASHIYRKVLGVWGFSATVPYKITDISPDGDLLVGNAFLVWDGTDWILDTDFSPAFSILRTYLALNGTRAFVVQSSSSNIRVFDKIEGVWVETSIITTVLTTADIDIMACSENGITIAHGKRSWNQRCYIYRFNGSTWDSYTSDNSIIWYNLEIFEDGSKVVAVTGGSPNFHVFSFNDETWTRTSPSTSLIYGMAYNNKRILLTLGSINSYMPKFYELTEINTFITFDAPPANGAVITADYTVNGIHKTDQRVIDISGEIQFGEPT